MNIRNIQEADIKACATLYAEVFSSDPWNEAWSKDLAAERLMHFYLSKGFVGVIAENEEGKDEAHNVIGFVLGNTEPFYDGTWFYLREMCIKTDLQNKGFGTQLLIRLEATLNDLAVKSIYLMTEKEIPAADFYLKNGFSLSQEMGFYEKRITH